MNNNYYFCGKHDQMKVYIPDDLLQLYSTGYNRRYQNVARTPELFAGFVRAIETMETVDKIDDLKNFSFLHYEQLRYNYSGFSSVRLSNRYVHRLVFKEYEDGIQVELIEIDDTHYGNKK